jgi:hypothetical protein
MKNQIEDPLKLKADAYFKACEKGEYRKAIKLLRELKLLNSICSSGDK